MRQVHVREAVTGEEVARANRAVYNAKRVEDYDRNSSIFNAAQEARIRGVLLMMQEVTGGERFLDVGCGTGNLLRLAHHIFPQCFGIDAAEKLLQRIAPVEDYARFAASRASHLPFASGTFDAVGMCAVLHHLYDARPALAEAYRVLRPGGMLFTDHDPNRYFTRFYHLWCRWTSRNRNGFFSPTEDLAEYHHVYSDGLDPEGIARDLKEIGFRHVRVTYRHPTNPDFTGARYVALQALKLASRIVPAKSLYTHFMILAQR